MGPYSHYILAARLAPTLQPDDPGAYYWGAVAPDIRYLANLRRDHTHLPPEQIQALLGCHPRLRSFLLGYQAHILIDQLDPARMVAAAFPLRLFKKALGKRVSPQQMTMLVELYYLQSSPAGAALSVEHNEVLAGLGISPEQTRLFHGGLREYFDARTFEAALAAYQKIGMIQNDRLEKYLAAYRAMQKRRLLHALLMRSIHNARLDAQVIAHVRAWIQESNA